ncbi:MAG: hypothetical protein ABL891_12375 [Burkholderiales bacterium]
MTYSEIVAYLKKEQDDNCLQLHELIDAKQATAAFSPAEVHQVVARLRDLGHHSTLGATAVVVGDDISYGMLRMLGILGEDVCDIRPFRSRNEAEEWLNTIDMPRTGGAGKMNRS